MEYIHEIYDAQTGETTFVPFTQAEIDESIANAKKWNMQNNKQTAKDLLVETDWTTIADIADSTKANPYLANSQAFIDYRNDLRAIVFNPPDTVIDFPVKPTEDWQSV